MGMTVSSQLNEALFSLGLGFAAGVLYDIFRILRRKIRAGAVTAITDGLFWLICAAGLFVLGLAAGEGRQRVFMTVLAALGAVLYFLTLSSLILWAGMYVANAIAFLLGLLMTPLKAIIKILRKFAVFLKNFFSSRFKRFKMIKNNNAQMRAAKRRTLGEIRDAPQTYRYSYENSSSDPHSVRRSNSGKARLKD